jgi:hypothetical protein
VYASPIRFRNGICLPNGFVCCIRVHCAAIAAKCNAACRNGWHTATSDTANSVIRTLRSDQVRFLCTSSNGPVPFLACAVWICHRRYFCPHYWHWGELSSGLINVSCRHSPGSPVVPVEPRVCSSNIHTRTHTHTHVPYRFNPKPVYQEGAPAELGSMELLMGVFRRLQTHSAHWFRWLCVVLFFSASIVFLVSSARIRLQVAMVLS